MRKIRDVLRYRHNAGLSLEAIARALKISKGVVAKYLRLASTAGLTWPIPETLDDSALEKLLYRQGNAREPTFAEPDYALVHQELKRKGVTLTLLWEEYRQAVGERSYQYPAFCTRYRDWAGKLNRSMRQIHRAGEKLFADYAGPTVPIVDAHTGEIRPASIFVAVLGASSYTFACATPGQTQTDWLTGMSRALTFIGGALAVVAFLEHTTGWGTILSEASRLGKLELFRWQPESSGIRPWFTDPQLFPLAFLSGLTVTTAALGTDQDLTQRMLTCSDAGRARRSVIFSGFIGIPVAALFLFVGLGLFTYFHHTDPSALNTMAEAGIQERSVFPYFIATALPEGLKGLLLLGLVAAAMSSLDSALGALSSSSVVDLIRPLTGNRHSPEFYLRFSRWLVPAFGFLLAGIAWLMRDTQDFLWTALRLATIPSGALLGGFLLGLLSRRGDDRSLALGMLTSAGFVALLLYLLEQGWIHFAWTLLTPIGTLWVIVVGVLFQDRNKRT